MMNAFINECKQIVQVEIWEWTRRVLGQCSSNALISIPLLVYCKHCLFSCSIRAPGVAGNAGSQISFATCCFDSALFGGGEEVAVDANSVNPSEFEFRERIGHTYVCVLFFFRLWGLQGLLKGCVFSHLMSD